MNLRDDSKGPSCIKRRHINTKHQLDPAEVDSIIQNYSKEKELNKAKRQIRELQNRTLTTLCLSPNQAQRKRMKKLSVLW